MDDEPCMIPSGRRFIGAVPTSLAFRAQIYHSPPFSLRDLLPMTHPQCIKEGGSCPVAVQWLEVANAAALNLIEQLLLCSAPEDHASTARRTPAAWSRPPRAAARRSGVPGRSRRARWRQMPPALSPRHTC